jgi:hypothetical protein
MSTLPELRSVAECWLRPIIIEPVAVNDVPS